jgi:O-methyltransferase
MRAKVTELPLLRVPLLYFATHSVRQVIQDRRSHVEAPHLHRSASQYGASTMVMLPKGVRETARRIRNIRHWKAGTAGNIARTAWPRTTHDILLLHIREVSETLSLGLQYAYNSFIEGDVVEFGTASGTTALLLARTMIAAEMTRPKKQLHLFDSFAGLPEATSSVDRGSFEVRSGIWTPGSCMVLSKDDLERLIQTVIEPNRIVIHAGWFADTIRWLKPDQKFCFIHFDGDMYQSTIDAIGGLLKKHAISNGAIICFDDWNCGQASPKHGERRAWSELIAEFGIEFSDWRAYSTMGRGFFIHDYRRS